MEIPRSAFSIDLACSSITISATNLERYVVFALGIKIKTGLGEFEVKLAQVRSYSKDGHKQNLGPGRLLRCSWYKRGLAQARASSQQGFYFQVALLEGAQPKLILDHTVRKVKKDKGKEKTIASGAPPSSKANSTDPERTSGTGKSVVAMTKTFGPLLVKNVGLWMEGDNFCTVKLSVDATVKLGPVTFILLGFTLTLDLSSLTHPDHLATFVPTVGLEGMAVSFERPPTRLTGRFRRFDNKTTSRGFQGAFAVSIAAWSKEGSIPEQMDMVLANGTKQLLAPAKDEMWLVAGLKAFQAVGAQAVFSLTLGAEPKFTVLATAKAVFPKPPTGTALTPGTSSEGQFPSAFWLSTSLSQVYVQGEAYFAITPSAVMGGGRLDMVVNKSMLASKLNMHITFSAYSDFLMLLHPFCFEVSVRISLYARAALSLLLWTEPFGPLEFSATLWLHGPPLGGEAKVHLLRCDIEIVFGPPPASPKALTLRQLSRMVKNLPLEALEEKPHESVSGHVVSITGGRAPMDGTEGAVGPIRIFTANMRIEVQARVPLLTARISGYTEPLASIITDNQNQISTPDLFARPMRLTEKFGQSEFFVSLKEPGGGEVALNAQPNVKGMPPALRSEMRQNEPSPEKPSPFSMHEFSTVDVGQSSNYSIPHIPSAEVLKDDDRFQVKAEIGYELNITETIEQDNCQR
ncbi:hypothetical protein F25303_5657 [Fusarium sp. NRRL 25303]|nr:hypothetical protein F25303_5657 [Fusarium sp. NRRL 25303]